MDATHTAPLIRHRSAAVAARAAIAAFGAIVLEVLADGIRGDDFERAFTSTPGAQFAALPDGSKQRLLNRGFRP